MTSLNVVTSRTSRVYLSAEQKPGVLGALIPAQYPREWGSSAHR